MSNRDRFNPSRARKAFAHAVSEAAEAKAERHALNRQRRADRAERVARRAYLEALRGDVLADWS
jgi:hypothetical protein